MQEDNLPLKIAAPIFVKKNDMLEIFLMQEYFFAFRKCCLNRSGN